MNKGAGSYMEFGLSHNDVTPVTAGSWPFLVGEAEPWICAENRTTDPCRFTHEYPR
jgi:hypothetical protein